jgi:acyl carrier protein
MDPRTLVRDFVIRNFLFGDASGLASDSVSLLDNGIMDSLGVMELINFLEIDLKIQVPDTDLVPQNLDSIDNLVAYIARRRASAS